MIVEVRIIRNVGMCVMLWNVRSLNVLIFCNCSWDCVRIMSTQEWTCNVARNLHKLFARKCIWCCVQCSRPHECLWNVREILYFERDRCCTWILIAELFESTLFAENDSCVLILNNFVCKMCAKCVNTSKVNLYEWIGHASKHINFLSNVYLVIAYKVTICMYTRIILTLICCWFNVCIFKKLRTYFFSKSKYQSNPKIKLWGGHDLEMTRSEAIEKSYITLYLCIVLCHRKMAASSTTNNGQDICMMGEIDVINNTMQKSPTMAQITISQKKAKAKLFSRAKRPPFWLGFQAMNCPNRDSDYPVDEMELISDLIKKGMEIDEAKERQNATPSFPFIIQEEWPSKREDGKERCQHFNLTQVPFDVEVDEHGFSFDYQIAIAFEIGSYKWSKEVIMEKSKRD